MPFSMFAACSSCILSSQKLLANKFSIWQVKVVRKERDAAPPAGKASTWDQRYIGLSQTEMPTHESMKQVSLSISTSPCSLLLALPRCCSPCSFYFLWYPMWCSFAWCLQITDPLLPTHFQVSNRVGMAWEELIVPLLKASKNVLIVSHGDTVRVLQGFMDGGFDVEWTRREAGKSLLSQQHPARQVESLRDLF